MNPARFATTKIRALDKAIRKSAIGPLIGLILLFITAPLLAPAEGLRCQFIFVTKLNKPTISGPVGLHPVDFQTATLRIARTAILAEMIYKRFFRPILGRSFLLENSTLDPVIFEFLNQSTVPYFDRAISQFANSNLPMLSFEVHSRSDAKAFFKTFVERLNFWLSYFYDEDSQEALPLQKIEIAPQKDPALLRTQHFNLVAKSKTAVLGPNEFEVAQVFSIQTRPDIKVDATDVAFQMISAMIFGGIRLLDWSSEGPEQTRH